jgi:hypothetical protein
MASYRVTQLEPSLELEPLTLPTGLRRPCLQEYEQRLTKGQATSADPLTYIGTSNAGFMGYWETKTIDDWIRGTPAGGLMPALPREVK